MEEHDLTSEVGMKSRLEDLGWVEWRSFETSVDGTMASKGVPSERLHIGGGVNLVLLTYLLT